MNHTQLRFALLASLGVLPLACGGSTLGEGQQRTRCSQPQTDPATGLVRCDEGYTHRPTSMTCSSNAGGVDQTPLPRVSPGSVLCDGDPSACEAFQYGYCQTGQFGGPVCVSGCSTDQDCGDGSICVCNGAGSWGSCVAATCQTDADCEPGYQCASYTTGASTGYSCQTPRDTCGTEGDCAPHETCQPHADGSRQCGPRAVAGRPFLVASKVRVAPIVQRSDWLVAARLGI